MLYYNSGSNFQHKSPITFLKFILENDIKISQLTFQEKIITKIDPIVKVMVKCCNFNIMFTIKCEVQRHIRPKEYV